MEADGLKTQFAPLFFFFLFYSCDSYDSLGVKIGLNLDSLDLLSGALILRLTESAGYDDRKRVNKINQRPYKRGSLGSV